jgi:hypothetical protein
VKPIAATTRTNIIDLNTKYTAMITTIINLTIKSHQDICPFLEEHRIRFIEDPGHGWIKVPLNLIAALGIASQISTYSYMDQAFAYLEEDCDLSIFFHAIGIGFDENKEAPANQLRQLFWASCIADVTNNEAACRNYQRFEAGALPAGYFPVVKKQVSLF